MCVFGRKTCVRVFEMHSYQNCYRYIYTSKHTHIALICLFYKIIKYGFGFGNKRDLFSAIVHQHTHTHIHFQSQSLSHVYEYHQKCHLYLQSKATHGSYIYIIKYARVAPFMLLHTFFSAKLTLSPYYGLKVRKQKSHLLLFYSVLIVH